ncbi:MAG: nucleotidyltransferase [Saprospiraceae bacterium]|nr:nucleotidyltransferase [Saprospiraceae bacterium]MCZ2339369.1 nucleotidyltransferase [Chitinophagales bacterium]
MKPTLLILAAGMGSRYGKLKQMDAFGPNGETIIDYSLYDAINAGFGKVVFIIRESFRAEFERYFRNRLGDKIEMEFVAQELQNIPSGFAIHPDREKPWGTAHAVWVAKSVIDEPFGVINADDYYGVDSFRQLAAFLTDTGETRDYSVVAYFLRNTLSDYGTVNRGVISVDGAGHLSTVKECTKIKRGEDGMIRYPADGDFEILDENTLVSMNMWGFRPSYFNHFEQYFGDFLLQHGEELTSEFFIPTIVDQLIHQNVLNVKVLDTESDWFGVTYQEDKPFVMDKLNRLIADGVYPNQLW